jgi:hypothetical protein
MAYRTLINYTSQQKSEMWIAGRVVNGAHVLSLRGMKVLVEIKHQCERKTTTTK